MPRTEIKPTVRTSVERRCLRYLALLEQRKELEKEINSLKTDIGDDLLKADDETIETDAFVAKLIKSTNSRVDPEKLASLGVKPRIIREATIETPYAYPKVTAKKNAKEA